MHSNRVYVIYWAPPSAPAMPSGYSDAITRFLTDVSADSGRLTNVYATDVQYGDPSGPGAYASTYGASVTATDPYPTVANQCTETAKNVTFSACLTDDQIGRDRSSGERPALAAGDGQPVHAHDPAWGGLLLFDPLRRRLRLCQ